MPELDELVSIGGWEFNGPAAACTDLSGLWTPPSYRGADRVVPGSTGETLRPRVAGPILFVLPIIVFGHANPAGTAFANVREGVRANIAEMMSKILPASGATPTRLLVHTLPDEKERRADCIVEAVEGPAAVGPSAVRFALVVKIPSGTFSLVTP